MAQPPLPNPIAQTMNLNSQQQVLFSVGNVLILPDGHEKGVTGFLSVLTDFDPHKNAMEPVFMWTPVHMLEQIGFAKGVVSITSVWELRVPLDKIFSIRKFIPSVGLPYVIIVLKQGKSLPPFYFREADLFLQAIAGLVRVSKREEDGKKDVYYINDIRDYLKPVATTPAPVVGGYASPSAPPQSQSVTHKVSSLPATPSTPVAASPSSSSSSTPSASASVKNVGWGILENFARVTNAARNTAGALWYKSEAEPMYSAAGKNYSRQSLMNPASGNASNSSSLSGSSDDWELLEKEPSILQRHAMEVRKNARGAPLGDREMGTFFDVTGNLANHERTIRYRIFEGGIDSNSAYNIRSELWKFLLNYYPFNSTLNQRVEIQLKRRRDYETYKLQWKSITSEQLAYHSHWRQMSHNIDKDVVRTDRTLDCFVDDQSLQLRMVNDILCTYAMYNFDLGYVQGMNDLVSVLLITMDFVEADAFWCFKGVMDRIGDNFEKDQSGIQRQLTQLANILKHLDADFYAYLESRQAFPMFFCFRWLLILFKREFELRDIQTLWDACFSDHYTQSFHLFVAIAMLLHCKSEIIRKDLGFDEILRLINEKEGHFDVNRVLVDADQLYRIFVNSCNKDIASLGDDGTNFNEDD